MGEKTYRYRQIDKCTDRLIERKQEKEGCVFVCQLIMELN